MTTLEEIISKKTVDFSDEILRFVADGKLSYIDAMVHFSEKYDIDIETVVSYISKNQQFMSKLQEEAENLNYIPKSNKLPF